MQSLPASRVAPILEPLWRSHARSSIPRRSRGPFENHGYLLGHPPSCLIILPLSNTTGQAGRGTRRPFPPGGCLRTLSG